MEKAVMQSCWIQRLNSACQTSASEDEELTKPSHVWTHFTKDFSSSSKRFHKAGHHTRSSSWPPKERTAKFSPSPTLKLVDPVDIKEEHLLSKAALPMFREENLRVPFEDASESNEFCSKTENLFSNQHTSHKSGSTLEALVPSSHAARTRDEFCEGDSKDEGKLKNLAAQKFQGLSKDNPSAVGDSTLFKRSFLNPNFNKESGSLQVGSGRVLGDAPCKGKFGASELAHRMVHIRGFSPDAAIGTSLSPALMGASADADNRIRLSPPHIKDVYPLTPFKLSINRSVVSGDRENKINKDQLGVATKKTSGRVTSKEVKTGRNFGFLHFAGQSKTLNPPPANPCVCGGSCNGGCADKVGVYNRGPDSKSIQRKQNASFGTFATNAGPLVTKDLYDLQSFNTDSRRCDPSVADHLLNPKEDLTAKMPPIRVASGDLTRSSFRETSLDDYWVKLLKDSGPVKLLDTSYSKATPPQERITDEYNRFSTANIWKPDEKEKLTFFQCITDEYNRFSTANIWKPDEKEKLTFFQCPSPHIPMNINAQTIYSCDVPQQTQTSPSSNFIPTKQTGLGYNQGASADRSPLEGSSMLRTLQEESLQGGMRRPASQTDNKEHNFCADGRTTEPSRPNQAWIQRWRSSSNLISMIGKTLLPSVGTEKELGSGPTTRPVITHYQEKEVDCFDRHLIEPSTRTSKLHMEGSVRCHDSGLGATRRGSFPVYRSHTSLRGKYMAPSVEAMAIVGNASGNLHSPSLQNRGSFSVWPCPREENFQERGHAKETVEDYIHGVDMDDLEYFLVHKMR